MAEGGKPANTNPLQNIGDITKCSKCQHVLQDPRTLLCLHSFCNQCLKTMDKTQVEGENGFECPQCQCFSPENKVRAVPFLEQLIEAEQKSKSGPKITKCERCGTKDAKWYCVECKKRNALCNECKTDHDDFVEHKVLSVDDLDNENMLLNKPVYCTKHTEIEVEYYCLQCETALCIKCKVEDHESHKSEPVRNVIQNSLLPYINRSIDEFEGNIRINRNKAQEVEKEKEAAIEKYNKIIREYENAACQQTQTLAWIKTAMAKTKGVNLFMHFQDGILGRVKQMASCSKGDAKFLMHASRCLPWAKHTKQVHLKRTATLPNPDNNPHPYTRISLMWNSIWMIHHSTANVYKFNMEGDKLGELKLNETIKIPRTAIAINSKTGVIAAESGVYTINNEGGFINEIIQGDYSDVSDVCMVEGIVYALEYRKGKVVSFEIENNVLIIKNEIELENYADENSCSGFNCVNTLIVKGNNIYLGMLYNHRIVQYDMTGGKLSVMADQRKGLVYPSISGISMDDQLLVAHRGNTKIEWRSAAGKTDFEIDRNSILPWFAVYASESKLLVVDDKDKTLKIYLHNQE